MSERRPGRPRLAPEVSQLPATTVPAPVHDALIREALRRDVPAAAIIREAVNFYLKNKPAA